MTLYFTMSNENAHDIEQETWRREKVEGEDSTTFSFSTQNDTVLWVAPNQQDNEGKLARFINLLNEKKVEYKVSDKHEPRNIVEKLFFGLIH